MILILDESADTRPEQYRQLLGQLAALPNIEFRVHQAQGSVRSVSEIYQGLRFGQDTMHVFAGLCAVDTRQHGEQMMRVLEDNGQTCIRMAAHKPRTSPYAFQVHGMLCIPWVLESAGKYGIKVVEIEVMCEQHVGEIRDPLQQTGT